MVTNVIHTVIPTDAREKVQYEPVFCSVYLVYSFTVSLVHDARYCFDILRKGTIKNLMVFSKTALVGRDELCVMNS